MPKKLLLLFFLLFVCRFTASANFNFDNNCLEIYKTIFSLKLNDARQQIQRQKQLTPQNGVLVLLDNYVDYFNLLMSDNRADYNRLKDLESERIDAVKDNEDNSPYYLYCQAEIYLQWGLIKGRFGDYTSSAFDLKKANNLYKDNEEKYPGFIPDQKGMAIINVTFGSLPPSLKSISRFFGMRGDITSGVKQLEDLYSALPRSKYGYLQNEVIFALCNIDIDVLHHKNNYTKLKSYLTQMDSNATLLKTYLLGYIATKTAHNDDAITYLEATPKSPQFATLPLIYYMLGNAKLNRMDADAPEPLNRYLKEYKGSNYIKDTYLKLAYYYLLNNDHTRYESYIKLVRTKGSNSDEKDQQALREANDTQPDTNVLRARLFYDGGYNDRALAELKKADVDDLKNLRDKIEYFYRLGRLYERTNRTNDALNYYQRTINIGKDTHYYYAAQSAMIIAEIYEQQKDITRAANFYHQALDMRNHEYQNSIDTECKEGLKRIGK